MVVVTKDIDDLTALADDDEAWMALGETVKAELTPVTNTFIRAGADAVADVGVAVDFAAVDASIDQIVTAYLDDWWATISTTEREAIREAIRKSNAGLLPTSGVQGIAAELEKTFGAARAEVIAETEATRMYSLGAEAGYVAGGIEEYIWVTARDERVDDTICEPLDGQKFPVGNGPIPPAHPR